MEQKIKAGRLIIFEGGEKVGKSTQIERLAGYLLGKGYGIVTTKEPGGGMHDIRKQIMQLDPNHPDLAYEELKLFVQDRTIHWNNLILPELNAGKVVLCDRWKYSTKAYQGHARGMDMKIIEASSNHAVDGKEADLVFLLDLPADAYLKRISKDNETEITRFEVEKVAFHEKVRQGFLVQAAENPERWVVLDATQSKEKLALAIQKAVKEKLGL
ncbi:MAG: dTMP kinase [bacterium]|nr:dTMP kinase [bacterium]